MQSGENLALMNLMYADAVVLLARTERDLKRFLEKFSEICERRCLQVNVGNSRMMIMEREVGFMCNLEVFDKNLHVVKELQSFWVMQTTIP